jgi:hypothetical protein
MSELRNGAGRMCQFAGYFLEGVDAVAVLLILTLAVPDLAAHARADGGDAKRTSIQSVTRALKGDRLRLPAAPATQLVQTLRPTSPTPPECQSEGHAPFGPFAAEVPGRCVG